MPSTSESAHNHLTSLHVCRAAIGAECNTNLTSLHVCGTAIEAECNPHSNTCIFYRISSLLVRGTAAKMSNAIMACDSIGGSNIDGSYNDSFSINISSSRNGSISIHECISHCRFNISAIATMRIRMMRARATIVSFTIAIAMLAMAMASKHKQQCVWLSLYNMVGAI